MGIFKNLQTSFALAQRPSQFVRWIDAVSAALDSAPGPGNFVEVADLAGGGPIGGAADTVDVAGQALVNQTTAGQTLTLPDPTDVTAGRRFTVSNVGTVTFTILGVALLAGRSRDFVWTGEAWSPLN
jgi:hypothetical protein